MFARMVLIILLCCPLLSAQVTAPEGIIAWNILTMEIGETGYIAPEHILISVVPDRVMHLYIAAPLHSTDYMGEMVRVHRNESGFHCFWNRSYDYKWDLSPVPEAGWIQITSFNLEGRAEDSDELMPPFP